MVKRATANDRGGPNKIKVPPRNPRIVPQPKPGILIICSTVKNQGDKASQKLIFPGIVDFIISYFFVVYERGLPVCKRKPDVKNCCPWFHIHLNSIICQAFHAPLETSPVTLLT